MKDWKAIAQANGLDLPAEELDPILAPLDSLETAFRPLVKHLLPGLEPATGLHDEDAE